eukprot:PRCOL_00003989-RA
MGVVVAGAAAAGAARAATAAPRPARRTAARAADASLTLRAPDDWHLHVRDGAGLASVVPHSASNFRRAVIMPNLTPPVTTIEMAAAYRARIEAAVPADVSFEPRMALYLTDNTTAEDVAEAHEAGIVHGYKLYPAGATTNSDAGVTDLANCADALKAMEALGVPLMVHGEVTHSHVDIFDREAKFLQEVLAPLLEAHPGLKLVVEHCTTAEAAAFVSSAGENVGATVTPQHLLLNRNALLVGGMRPHNFCLPVLKRETHRQALVDAVTSSAVGHKFFLGTDSAPHPKGAKEDAGALDKLEGFASLNGPRFYGLEPNEDTVTLVRENWRVPDEYEFADTVVVPLKAGETLRWKLSDQ